jgi:hypothetical protein
VGTFGQASDERKQGPRCHSYLMMFKVPKVSKRSKIYEF